MHSSPFHDSLRISLRARLRRARELTDSLFAMLDPAALSTRPIPERHRIIFYLGHLEAFDWNLLARTAHGLDPFNEQFDTLFAFGIDPVGGSLPDDSPADWPELSQILEYNRRVRRTVDQLLTSVDFNKSADVHNGLVFHVAIEHRLMHAETLAYMFHWLDPDQKARPARPRRLASIRGKPPRKVEIPAGLATLGRSHADGGFGWDNEFGETVFDVDGFEIDRFNVTNGEFMAFVQAGGYEDRSLWTTADWTWKSKAGIIHPRFWLPGSGGWMLRNMFEIIPLRESWPVYVSHAEAAAYARWAGGSLPTEPQFHRAAYATVDGAERPYPWGKDLPENDRGNFDFHGWDPVAVGSYPNGDSEFGVSDLLGNGWEWTSTPFEPFAGFERFHFYPGYSTSFFDGNHYVVKGGSARTSACMLRRSFRNWFQPHYPHIYATFRTVAA